MYCPAEYEPGSLTPAEYEEYVLNNSAVAGFWSAADEEEEEQFREYVLNNSAVAGFWSAADVLDFGEGQPAADEEEQGEDSEEEDDDEQVPGPPGAVVPLFLRGGRGRGRGRGGQRGERGGHDEDGVGPQE